MQWSHWWAGLMGASESDRIYDCLPLYHSTGGIVAPGAMLVAGGSVVIRDRFSASDFWEDLCRWDRNIFQYIGELCRYLLRAGPAPHESAHRLRLACGNGLRPDVWPEFQRRFHIPRVLEFYGAAEGSVTLFNVEGEPGAIGRIPPYLSHRFRVVLVRYDVDADAPARDPQGFCILARRERWARRSRRSPPGRRTSPAGSRAIPARPRRNASCSATSSSPATPGFAPAI